MVVRFEISYFASGGERERERERPGLKSGGGGGGGGGRMQRSNTGNTRTVVIYDERTGENDGGREGVARISGNSALSPGRNFFSMIFEAKGLRTRGEVRGFTCRGTRVSLSSHLAGFDDGRCCCAGNTSGRGRTRAGGGGQERKGVRVALRWKEAGDATRCGVARTRVSERKREGARERGRERVAGLHAFFFHTPRIDPGVIQNGGRGRVSQ